MTPQDKLGQKQEVSIDEWDDMVRERYKIPRNLWKAMSTQESGGDWDATSPTGVKGKYQVTEATAKQYGLDRNDPFQQTVAAARYLRDQYDALKDLPEDNARWLGAVGRYYGGPGAVDSSGGVSTKSPDGVSTPDKHIERVAKLWGQFERSGQDTPPVDEYGRATVDETGRPIKWQSVNKPAPAKPPAPKIQSRGPVRKPAPLPTFDGDPTQQMLQDVAARPVTKQKQGDVLPTKPNRFQQRSTAGQIGEILTSGAMRGVEGLYKAASIAHPQAWGKGLMTPEAQQALQQQEAEQDVEYPTAAPVARGLTTAGVQAPVYMAGGAAGLPAAMLTAGYMNAAQEDWSKDPVRSAVRTGINATLPFAASRGANALIRPITRPGVVATESIAGAAGNVVPEAIEQMAFEGQLDPQRLAQTGLMGGLSPLNVTGAGRQAEANQQARLAKVQKATGSPVTAEASPEVAPEAAPAAPEEAATPRYTPTPEVEQGVTVADRARTRVQSARDSGDVVGEINALEGERQAVKAAMASVGRRDAIGRRALGERLASIDQEISQAKAKARGRTPQQPQTPPETPFRETPSAEQQRIPRTPTPDENAPTADLTQDLAPTEREIDIPDTGTMPPPDVPVTEDLVPAPPPEQPQRGVNTIYGRRSGTPIPGRQMPQAATTEQARQPKPPVPFPMQRPRRVPGENVEVRRSGFREAVEDARLRRDPEAMRQHQMERRRAEREASLKGVYGKFAEYAHRRTLPVHKADETVPGEINQEGNQYSLAEHPELRSLLDLPEMPPYYVEEGKYNPAWKDAAQDTLNALAELGDKPRSSEMGLDDLRGVYQRLSLAAKRKNTVISDDLKKTFTDTAQSLIKSQTNFARFRVDDTIESLVRRVYNAKGQFSRGEAAQISREVQRIAKEYGLTPTYAQEWFKLAQAEAKNRAASGRPAIESRGGEAGGYGAESRVGENVQRRATGTTGRIADEVPIPAPRSRPRAVPASETSQRGDTVASTEEAATPRSAEPRPAAKPAGTVAAEQPARAAEPVAETPQVEAPAETPAPKPRRAPAKPVAKKEAAPKVNEKTLTEAGWQKKSPAEFTHPDGREIYRNEKGTWVVARDGDTVSSHESLRDAIASVAGERVGEISPPRGESAPKTEGTRTPAASEQPAPKSTPLADDVLRRPQPKVDEEPFPQLQKPVNMPLPEPELPSKQAKAPEPPAAKPQKAQRKPKAEKPKRMTRAALEDAAVGKAVEKWKKTTGERTYAPPMMTIEVDGRDVMVHTSIVAKLAGYEPVPKEVNYYRKAQPTEAPAAPEAATSDLKAKAQDLKARSPFAKAKAEDKAAVAAESADVAPVFTESELRVDKPRTSRRPSAAGINGEVRVDVNAPFSVTDESNWNRLGNIDNIRATVEARLDFKTGKSPSKKEAVWKVYSKQGDLIAKGLTYDDALKVAKKHVLSSNPQTATSKPKFVEDAEARLKDASSGKLAGSGAQALADQAIVSGYKLYKAGMQFKDWTRQMLREFGGKVRPYLRDTWQKLSAAAKEFYRDEEGSAPASPGPPRRNRVTEAVRQNAARQPKQQAPPQQAAPQATPPKTASTPKGKDMSIGRMFRTPLSNLNYTGTYERLAGETGKEISEAIRNYQVSGKDKGSSIADLRRELAPKIKEVRDSGMTLLADQMEAHIDSIGEPAGVWSKAAGKLKGFQYNAKLRLNPRSTIINLAQPMQTLWPHLSSKDMASIYKEAVFGGGWKRVHDLAVSESGGKVEGIDASAKQGGFADKYLNWFGKSSDLNRVVGHLAGERIADRMGLTGDAKRRMAADWAKKVEFDNSKYDVPPAFRGDAASVLMQFKPFMVKNLERIASDWNKGISGVSDGNLARRSKMVIGQIALGGMKSVIPGVAHLKAIGGVFVLGTLAKMLGKHMDQEYANKTAEALFFGLPGLFGGQDWSGSVGIIDEPFGTTTWEKIGSFLLGPTVSTAVKLIDGVAGVAGAEDEAKRNAALMRTVKGVTPAGKTAETVISAFKNKGRPSIKTGKTEMPMTDREVGATIATLGMGTPIRQSNYYTQQEIDKDLPKSEKAILGRLLGKQPITDYAQSHRLTEQSTATPLPSSRRTATRRAASRRASRRRAIGQ